jgi:hypothetical protein
MALTSSLVCLYTGWVFNMIAQDGNVGRVYIVTVAVVERNGYLETNFIFG